MGFDAGFALVGVMHEKSCGCSEQVCRCACACVVVSVYLWSEIRGGRQSSLPPPPPPLLRVLGSHSCLH